MQYQPRMQFPGAGAFPQFEQQAAVQGPQSNPQVLGYLGRALSLEFSAGQHYLAQASLAKYRGEAEYAEGFIILANEEFQHANLITDRMVAHGALPAGSVLSPATPANSILDALRTCEAREIMLINLYGEAANFSANIGALADHALFSRLLEEEQTQLVRVHGWMEEYYKNMIHNQAPMGSFV